MLVPLPTALAAALARAKAQHAAGVAPTIPFIPETRTDTRQAEAFGTPDALLLDWKSWETQLLGHAGALRPYLNFIHGELADEAERIPKMLNERSQSEPFPGHAARMVAAAERWFGVPVPGQSLDAQLARIEDPKYWRRFLNVRVRQAREHLHLKLGLIGADARQYCSADAQATRRTQLQSQAQWLKDTVLRATIDGKTVEIPLEQVAKSERQKLARIYAFVKAMDTLAQDDDLTVALLTTTLEGEWHANPRFAQDGHQWNGSTPREANQELGRRFQAIRRDLDKQGVRLSGLWAGEPHQDGCPHRHHWLMYAPEHERAVLAAFLRYFPGKLKLRRGESAESDRIIDSREDALRGVMRPKAHAQEGAQVDVAIIDRARGSGASYALKYVMKAVLSESGYEDMVRAVPELESDAEDRSKALRTQHSIDAHRSVWRMRSFQFFGVMNCFSLWDELRRVKVRPVELQLLALWRLARGGDAEGTLVADQQRGDAYGFLKAMGGLAAAVQAEQLELGVDAPARARIYTSPTETRYGEIGQRIEGVELVQPATGKDKEAKTLERIETRTVRWELVPKPPKPLPEDDAWDGGETVGKPKTTPTDTKRDS